MIRAEFATIKIAVFPAGDQQRSASSDSSSHKDRSRL